MPAETRPQGLWQFLLGTLLGWLAPGSTPNPEQDAPAPDDVVNNGIGSGRSSDFAHPFGAAGKLHLVTSVLQLCKHLCSCVQDKCVRTTLVQLFHSIALVVGCLQAAAKRSVHAFGVALSTFTHLLRVGQSCTVDCLTRSWAACSRFPKKHGVLALAFVAIYIAVKLHGRQQPQAAFNTPDSWQHVHQAGAAALNSTSDGLLSIARMFKESEALMAINAKALTSAADVAAKYGMSGLPVAEGAMDQIRKDQVVSAVKALHELAAESRNLGIAEHTLCMDTTFEYRNMTIKIGQLHFDVRFGLASGNPAVLAQMVQQVHGSLHGIVDWANRTDGTYNQAQEVGQQRQKLARGLQSSSLELGGLVPRLPSLAGQHRSNAHSKGHEAAQLQLLADDAWLTNTKCRLQKEKMQAAKTALAHSEAHQQLTAVAASLQDMHDQITSGAIHQHMQMLSAKHYEALESRESLLSVLGNAKSVSIDPAFAQHLADFLGDMRKAIDDAATKASSICSGSRHLVAL